MPTLNEVQQARKVATESASKASAATSAGYSIPDELKNKLNEAYEYNADLVEPLDKATSSYLSSPNVAREKYQDIFNPFTREKLVSQYTQTEALPMLTLSNILGQRRGSIADSINAGTNAYNSYTSGLTNTANLNRNLYQDLLNEYDSETTRNYNNQKLALEQSKSSGSSIDDLLKYYNAFSLNQGQQDTLSNWSAASNSINRIQNVLKNDPDLFKTAAAQGIAGLGRLFNSDARSLKPDLSNLVDVLSRSRSGAALNKDEQKLYADFVQGDPLSTLMGYTEGPGKALEILKEIADKNTSVYGSREDASNQLFNVITGGLGVGGQQNQSQEIKVQDLATGKFGWIPQNEFNPSRYKAL